MAAKIINATEARVGTNILIDGDPFTIKKIDISKTGKHGHSKARIEASGILKPGKKVFVIPGHDKIEVPHVDKRKGQVLSISKDVSVMDLETFETIDVPCAEDIKSELAETNNVEYWNVEGRTIVKRKL
ncbi:translation initiation factor IF-5A [Candidatus Pacearchaeota archaeon]|nr:translation initiation factor IF-5A [Candidatus Pacearchaeota archaeon]